MLSAKPFWLSVAALGMLSGVAQANEPQRVEVTGEIMDTWCYFSGVMGSPESTLGTAHHTCALWCAAGGIPVGILSPDGTVYMVLKIEGDDAVAGGDTMMDIQSDTVTADGLLYERDGVNYILVENLTANEGIINLTHDEYGTIPGFAIPELN